MHPSYPKAFQDFSEKSLRHNGYGLRSYLTVLAYADVIGKVLLPESEAAEIALRKSATLYASFDDTVLPNVAGDRSVATRFNHETEKGKFVFEKGFDDKVFRVAKGKGVRGGALEATDVLPRNGRIFYPAKGNIAYRPGGWGGSVSVWINTDPNLQLKTRFCDPVQITQKGANNGGIWFDFNDAKPRDLRLGVFPAATDTRPAIKEEDPNAPLVAVKAVPFKSGEWHHVVLTWHDLDTGEKNATAALYIDGKQIGVIKDQELGMNWELEHAGIYFAVNYIGLLDELAVFNRPLGADEVALLQRKPEVLAGLTK